MEPRLCDKRLPTTSETTACFRPEFSWKLGDFGPASHVLRLRASVGADDMGMPGSLE